MFFLLLIGFSELGYCYMDDKIILSGKLQSFNEKEVKIVTQNKVFTLTRKMILLYVLTNDQPINVEVSLTELQSFKQAAAK